MPLSLQHAHPWQLSIDRAKQIQSQLRSLVVTEDRLGTVRTVAGVDVGYDKDTDTSQAAVVVLSFPELELLERQIDRYPNPFPYVPGFLSFREIPPILQALDKLKTLPDLILCDGQGIAHPRRFGLACHLGVLTDIPTIGVAKSRLVGTYDPVPSERGNWVSLYHQGEEIGVVLRTRSNVNPVFVSVGHRISLKGAIDYTLQCTPRYRLPETTRLADKLSREAAV
ncbi:endonuclease V [Leptolyngbya valderiana BDU 20041]|uniref:deoxyribonuclease V n=1 Tax=Baaleninema simplex TaxID=2862350 RepID=UPI00034902C9|nr:deoxyribonuclease V [Baaleninema simplex]MDC0831836.1 deoxyribonuclease V [Geitlerinema sp. CS-897]OAB63802.1 endonuclease V [Leptolyngbya valderiana BDU 20041]PPT09062.1 Endonuclease V [Geitlerinema sp. FC II]